MKKHIILMAATIAVAGAQANFVILYDGATGNLTNDLAAFDAVQELGGGTNAYGVANVPPTTYFGASYGNAMRMYDFSTIEKPELQGETTAAITGQYRLDFKSYNNSSNMASTAIRFRMANSGDSITAESRCAFSLSWQADGMFTAKYSDHGLNNGDAADDVDTIRYRPTGNPFDNLCKVIDVTVVGNNFTNSSYPYSLYGEDRVLNPQSYDVYVDGGSGFELLNDSTNVWEANGLSYTLERSVNEYNPALGLQRFGLLGSGNSDTDPDIYFDNITLSTYPNVPEQAYLDLTIVGSGSLNLPAGWYTLDTNLVLTATPDPGWLFMGWSGSLYGDYTSATTNLTMDFNKTVTATFSDDADFDGILNTNETVFGTDPRKSDTDEDGLTDFEELYTYSTDPIDRDMDGDGLLDGQEVLIYFTDPELSDTDMDGFSDFFEVNAGYDPTSDTSTPDLLSTILTAIEFQFNAANGISYRIEGTDDLSAPWEVVETDIIGSGDVVKRFYSIEGQTNTFFRVKRN